MATLPPMEIALEQAETALRKVRDAIAEEYAAQLLLARMRQGYSAADATIWANSHGIETAQHILNLASVIQVEIDERVEQLLAKERAATPKWN